MPPLAPCPPHAMRDFAERWSLAEPTVAAFIWALVPHRHDVDDLVQRTAQALMSRYDEYAPDRPFTAWAIGAAKIEVLRFRQERGRDRLVFDDATIDSVAAAYQQSEAELGEMRRVLYDCIARLGGRLEQVLRMRHIEDLKPAAIAERLGLSANAVLVSLHRARAAVRACVERRLYGAGGER